MEDAIVFKEVASLDEIGVFELCRFQSVDGKPAFTGAPNEAAFILLNCSNNSVGHA